MKALVKTKRGFGNLELREIPEPQCGKDQVKIGIKATGVCGTDIHIIRDEYKVEPPVVIGHEFCGQIVDVGSNVTGLSCGDRVVAENVCISCGTCDLCETGHYALCNEREAQGVNIDGGFAEYIVCEANNVYAIPDNISYDEGALSEPLVCCAHAVLEQTTIRAGEIVLVSGPGAIGLLCAQIAMAEGAEVILSGTSADAQRFAIAKEIGIETCVNVESDDLNGIVFDRTHHLGVDVVLECSGFEDAPNSGLDLVRKRGRYTQVGLFGKRINIDFDKVCYKEVLVSGTLSHTREAWRRGLGLVAEGTIELKPLITHKVALSEWETAFDLFEKKDGVKIIVYPE